MNPNAVLTAGRQGKPRGATPVPTSAAAEEEQDFNIFVSLLLQLLENYCRMQPILLL